jgi:hypothetical protein
MFGIGMTEIIMMLIYLAVVGLSIILWLSCLIDIIKSEFQGNNKIIWLLVVIFVPLLGMILYYIFGRKQKISPSVHQISPSSINGAFCSSCGVKSDTDSKYCTQCGTVRA